MKQILYFSAKWCSSCQTTTPIVEQFKKNNQVNVSVVDTDYDVSLTQQYNVKSIPTIVVLENGTEIKRYIGSVTMNQLNQLING